MGNPCLYVYPLNADGSAGSLSRIEWPTSKGLVTCENVHLRVRQESRAPISSPYHVQYGSYQQLTIEVAGLTTGDHEDFIAKLDAVDSSLTMGSTVHFCRDRDKAGVWPLTDLTYLVWGVPTQNALSVYTVNAEELLGIDTTPSLAVGDHVIIETTQPEGHRSRNRISVKTGTTNLQFDFPSGNGVFFNASATRAWMHWEGMHPALRLHPDSLLQPRLRRSGPMTYEWSATFVSVPTQISDLITGSGP